MLTQEIIRRKRDGKALAPQEIGALVSGLTDGSVSEGQAAAFAMAVFFNGMSSEECVGLTEAMRDSGSVLAWPELSDHGPVVDKHSTGGVGDNVSLMLAPMLAAAGAYVPMISGRGLGHTGGTLDKLDSIPGYRSQPGIDLFRDTVAKTGCAIIGQTEDLAPADRRLYAIRDVTATVESIPLITASILSKKLAAGLSALVLDVKTGSGAFMKDEDDAVALARSLVDTANGAGLRTSALITDIDEPLASAAGNAVEVMNAVDYLTGARRDARLHDVVLALGAELLRLSGLAPDADSGRVRLEDALSSGAACERFARMVTALGGPADFVENAGDHLPAAPVQIPALPRGTGTVASIDTRAIGLAVVELGGGRRRASDEIDHAVGLTGLASKGRTVGPDRPLALIHARDDGTAEKAANILQEAYKLGDAAPSGPPVRRHI
ncbi:MAG: thymidine phosphorylase, partial [Hyphomicrobiales bacterium]